MNKKETFPEMIERLRKYEEENKPNFSTMTDEQLKKININTMLISEEEADEFISELKKRGLVKSA